MCWFSINPGNIKVLNHLRAAPALYRDRFTFLALPFIYNWRSNIDLCRVVGKRAILSPRIICHDFTTLTNSFHSVVTCLVFDLVARRPQRVKAHEVIDVLLRFIAWQLFNALISHYLVPRQWLIQRWPTEIRVQRTWKYYHNMSRIHDFFSGATTLLNHSLCMAHTKIRQISYS